MRRLLASLALMLTLVWGMDRAVGFGMKQLFHHSTSLEDGDVLRRAWDYRAPIVVCGSSRATHHYAVDSLGSMLGVKAYNLGRDGSFGPLYEYGVAGVMLHHYTPSVWIMDVDRAIVRGPELTGRLSCFLPYADSEPAAREVIALRSRYEALRMWSRVYRYNSLVLSLLAPHLGKPVHPRLGFRPLLGEYTPALPAADPPGARETGPAAVDTLKLRYLQRTIDLLRSRGVEVLAVQSPHYFVSPAGERDCLQEEREMQELFGRMQVPLLDFSATRIARFRDPSLFEDPAHMNEAGALIFTRMLADSLRMLRPGLLPTAATARPQGTPGTGGSARPPHRNSQRTSDLRARLAVVD
jgi:hypothetical protein